MRQAGMLAVGLWHEAIMQNRATESRRWGEAHEFVVAASP